MTAPNVTRFDDLEPRPWRNGCGVTRTIRPMAETGGWALSIATIERTTEFSVIPATQRVQLAIDAVRLAIDGVDVDLRAGEQVRFSGEQRVTGASAAESSLVLNLMYADGTPELKMDLVRDASDIPNRALAVVVLGGTLEASGSTLGALDALLLRPDEAARGLTGSGQFAVVREVS